MIIVWSAPTQQEGVVNLSVMLYLPTAVLVVEVVGVLDPSVVEAAVELVMSNIGRHLPMDINQAINIPCQYQM